MKILVNIDYKKKYNFGFDVDIVSKKVINEVLKVERVDYDISVNILLVSSTNIKKINKEERDINKITDVLSFPNIQFKKASNFKEYVKKDIVDVSIIDLNTKTIFLGDIVINGDFVIKKSKEYNHSIKREYAFLLTHSMLHLLGYDHVDKISENKMFKKQDIILDNVNIKR